MRVEAARRRADIASTEGWPSKAFRAAPASESGAGTCAAAGRHKSNTLTGDFLILVEGCNKCAEVTRTGCQR